MSQTPLDILWVTVAAALVFVMQAGFLCLESGLTRTKNNINVAIKNLTDVGISTVLFWAFGYALMFGNSVLGLAGGTHFLFSDTSAQTIVFFVYQMMFCSTAVTIVSGAVAERMRFNGYVGVSIVVSGLIYPIFGHWAWNANGWLSKMGFIDFAGSTVVHSVGGWIALAGVLVVGPRTGRFTEDGQARQIPHSNLPIAIMGVLILWFGWMGFNGGGTLAMNDKVPSLVANTLLAGSGGLVSSLVFGALWYKRTNVFLVINSSLAGLVSITANCHVVSTSSALLIGAIGGLVSLGTHRLLERFRIDDVVGAIPVHLGGGIWGTIAVALFANQDQLATPDRLTQFGAQMLGIGACFAWIFGLSYLMLLGINRVSPLRVTAEDEFRGLNVSEHQASSELVDLLRVMDEHSQSRDPRHRAPVEPFTVIGQIAGHYNRVMDAVQEAMARTAAIVATAKDAIITFSKDSLTITTCNPAAESIFGYSEAELRGQQMARFIGPQENTKDQGEDRATNREAESLTSGELFMDNILLSGLIERGGSREVLGVRRDGSTFPMEFMVAETTTNHQSFYTGTFRDITDRKRTQQLTIQREALIRSNKELEQFAYIASHDLQEPLRKVRAFGERLQQTAGRALDERSSDYLARMRASVTRMQTLISDLLLLSRVAHRSKPFLPVDLNEIVKEVASDLETLVARTQGKINHNKLAVIHADPTQMRQLLQNLIGNGLKFHRENTPPVITIRSRPLSNGRDVQIVVEDNGIGFKSEFSERIFGAFQRLHGREAYDGTGIGLAVCRKIVERHEGNIVAESEAGKGSKFIVTLPTTQGASADPTRNENLRLNDTIAMDAWEGANPA